MLADRAGVAELVDAPDSKTGAVPATIPTLELPLFSATAKAKGFIMRYLTILLVLLTLSGCAAWGECMDNRKPGEDAVTCGIDTL